MQPTDPFELPRRERDHSDRLIPMINVVFLLLTFFMVAGTMRAADTLKIEPPSADAAGTLAKDDLVLYLDRDGAVALGQERMALDAALGEIAAVVKQQPEKGVQLKADKATTAIDILPVLRRLSEIGVKRLQLVALKEESR